MRYLITSRIIDAVGRIAQAAIPSTILLLCLREAVKGVQALAGRTTVVDARLAVPIDVSVEFNGQLLIAVFVMACLVCCLVGVVIGQRWHNEANVRNLAEDKNALEALLSQKRTSSGLTREGRTNPDDL